MPKGLTKGGAAGNCGAAFHTRSSGLAADKYILIGITTSPRPKRYLLDSITSILAACDEVRPTIWVAPNFIDPDENWNEVRRLIGSTGRILDPLVPKTLRDHVQERDDCRDFREGNCIYASEWSHRGIQHNTDRLMQAMIDHGPDHFLTFQDDVALCKRAVDRMWSVARTFLPRGSPLVGAVSFYSPHHDCGASRRAMWWYEPNRFYGELALLWRRRCAAEFLKSSNPSNAHDLEIQRFFVDNRSKWRLFGHSPCLVQHTGVESARGAVTAGMVRETPNFRADHNAVNQAKEW